MADNLIGKTFGRLTVIDRANDYISPSGYRSAQWLCECSCNNHTKKIVRESHLKDGNTTSCGCYAIEINKEKNKKFNKYDLSNDEYGIGYTANTNEQFLFDKEDFDLIKNFCWSVSAYGYICCTRRHNTSVLLHRLVVNADNDKLVDHKNHNTFDNRKSNLRIVDKSQNMMNRRIAKNNTSGVTGITWRNDSNKWRVRIQVNNKSISIGSYDTIEDAIEARNKAEEKYFGEYSYANSMKGER